MTQRPQVGILHLALVALALSGCDGEEPSEPSPAPVPSCTDGLENGDETDVDCGGSCPSCEPEPSCTDDIENGDETDVDCGGSCPSCEPADCSDGSRNGDETDVDCGGDCPIGCEQGQECVEHDDCLTTFCNPDANRCAPTDCDDGYLNGNETDVDCGGECETLCADDASCVDGSNCESGFCTPDTNVCHTPDCSDGYLTGDETDIDCGGSCDDGCAAGSTCVEADDCTTEFCRPSDNTCRAQTCTDDYLNQDETDVDCGGVCDNTCGDGETCALDGDCVSGYCVPVADICAPEVCNDDALSTGETDIDCGGICGPTCLVDDDCLGDDDCLDDFCHPVSETCQTPTCPDGYQNQGETALDCGGPNCVTNCANGDGCVDGDDCTSEFCRPSDDTCRAPACPDGYQNQGETDVDCGGPSCVTKCANGETCVDDGDCVSDNCQGTCAADTRTLSLESTPPQGEGTWGVIYASPPGMTFCTDGDPAVVTIDYPVGTVVTLTAHEDGPTWPFNGWTVEPGNTTPTTCSIDVTMDTDRSVTASFPLIGGGEVCP